MKVGTFVFDHIERTAKIVSLDGKEEVTLPEMQRVKVSMWGFEDKKEETTLVIGGLVSYISNGYILLELEVLND